MEKRGTRRISVKREAIFNRNGASSKCFLISVSETGLQLIVPQSQGHGTNGLPQRFTLTLPVSPDKTIDISCRQVWSDGDIIGAEIEEPTADYKAFYRQSYFNLKKEISHDSIAVIGMGCYYPGAPTLRAFWENILARRREFRRLPDQRLPLSDYYDADPAVPDKTYADRAAVIDGFAFDWVKRGIPKTVVDSSDIVHWLALEVAVRALEDAGYSRQKTPCDRTGVILGNTLTGEYSRSQNMRLRWPYVSKIVKAAAARKGLPPEFTKDFLLTMEELYKSAFAPVTEDTLAGNLSNTIAGRICNFLDLHGGGYTVDGACSSSLIAVATAATALSNGTLDLAVAGGVDISLDTFELVGFAKTRALTREDMRVYDRKASGFIPGEGAGFIVLKRLQDARAHGNYVYAVLRGWGISSDGRGGITAPKAEAQALAIKRAYGKAGYDLRSVDFIEGHGTGTAAGDRAEVEGIAMAMGPGEPSGLRSCGLTSLKSLIGHTKAASGIGGFIKAVLAVNRRVIPPTAGCTEPNDVFQDRAKTLFPVLHGEVHDVGRTMRAGVSGMGFGGINCHVTIESDGPPASTVDTIVGERELLASWQESEIFALSAGDLDDMADKINGLKKLAAGISSGEMTDLSSHLTQDVNLNSRLRAAVIADSPDKLIECLDRALAMLGDSKISEGTVIASPQQDVWIGSNLRTPRTGFLFPGQGSQQLGMGKTVIERYEWAGELAARIDPYLAEHGYKKIIGTMYPPTDRAVDGEQIKAWKKALSESDTAQPSICLASILWMRRLERLGIVPHAAGGHSLGELTAFHAAGAFPDTALMLFAAFRGKITAAKVNEAGTMASLACDRKKAQEILDKTGGYAVLANVNSPVQTVISGEKKAVEDAINLAAARGIGAKRLPVANAFHSRFMDGASSVLAKDAPITETLPASRVRLFTSIDGSPVPRGADLKKHFSRQLTHSVDFISLVNNMAGECDMLVEVGPGRVLSDLALSITGGSKIHCLPVEAKAGDDRPLNTVIACYYVNGGAVKWPALFQNRLVRPFVPAFKRVFIENPCERPSFRVEEAALRPEADTSRSTEAAPRKDEITPPGYGAESGPAGTPQKLLALVSEMTGFPIDSISLDHRLLDDLNLDSIKAGQLVAKAMKLYHAEGKIDPMASANSSLKDIYDLIKSEQRQEGPLGQPGRPVTNAPAQDSWVREFTIKYLSLPLLPPAVGEERQKNMLIVTDGPGGHDGLSAITGRKRLLATFISYDAIPLDSPEALGKYDYFVFLLPDGPEGSPTPEKTREMAGRLHSIAATIAAMKTRTPKPAYAVVQYGGTDFFSLGNGAPVEAKGAAAFLSSLHHENPDERIRVLQFDKNDPASTFAKTIDELQSPDAFAAAVYDGDLMRYVPVLSPVKPQDFHSRPITWTGKDVVLVTGGARGVTAECALAFARKTGVRLALAGSTADTGDAEIRESLGRYREDGVHYRYYACDITDENAVRSLIGRIKGELGPITGFIHGAALNRPRRAEQVTEEAAYKEIGPKVLGAINVLEALEGGPVKLIAALGSIIGVTGMAGNAWYAFSNEVLNLLLQRFKSRNPAAEIITCAFSVWAEVGMGAKMGSVESLSKMGIRAIPKELGVESFMRLTASTTWEPQVVVAGRLGSIDTMRSPMTFRRARFTEEVIFYERGVEIEAKAVLTTERDKYLKDHVFRGTHLFPTVFGIEAMQQAVMAVTATGEPRNIEIEDISLSYPITVDPGGQTEIRIRALVLEPGRAGEPMKVKAAITVDQTAFSKNHFEATFVLNGVDTGARPYAAGIPDDGLDIEPREDLYGHMLFQGPSFQRIERIMSMTEGRCVFEAATRPPDPDFDHTHGPFTAGDPYFRDTLLQSVQIILPDVIALPVGIAKWEISRRPQGPGRYNVIVEIRERGSDTIVSDVTAISPDGVIVEEILGYSVRIIEVKRDAPALKDIVSPDRWDEERIRRRLSELCKGAGVEPPGITVKHIPNLSGMARPERHQIERTLLSRACQAAPQVSAGYSGPMTVEWTEQGKPYIAEDGNIALSCSHDAKLLICSAGPAPQGCDVEPVTHRDPEEWSLMLGHENQALLESLNKSDNSYDRAATRVWCAVEALRKATDMRQGRLTYSSSSGDCATLSAAEGITVFTFPVRLLRGPERVIAIAVRQSPLSSQTDTITPARPSAAPQESPAGFNDGGPEGQRVFVCRFPLGLKDNSAVSGGVNFANYASWLGNVRETALKPIGRYISDEFYSGHFMVTNHTDTRIIRHVRNHETIEARTWVDRILGYKDSSLVLKFEWSKRAHDGVAVPIAFSSHQVSWIKVVGHGAVEPVECPPFFASFLRENNFAPRRDIDRQTGDMPAPEAFMEGEGGEPIQAYDLIGRNRRLAAETTFETTTQHSNLAQNVYFSNYFTWQGHLIDKYLFELDPRLYRGMSPQGQFATTRCVVTHLREAMPFDRIAVTMQIRRVWRRVIELYFEYFRVEPGNERVKLAYGNHTLTWVSTDETDKYVAGDIPEPFINGITSASSIQINPRSNR